MFFLCRVSKRKRITANILNSLLPNIGIGIVSVLKIIYWPSFTTKSKIIKIIK